MTLATNNQLREIILQRRLLTNVPYDAWGFIGVAFRIKDSNSPYESIYLRPVNARVNVQVRRNHSIQYYSYPDFEYDRLRKESPERYEAYGDMEVNSWISVRTVVKDAQATLFLNDNTQTSLVVNDLKLGADVTGAIGIWVEAGTEGYFADLRILQN